MCPFSIIAFLQPTTVDKEPKKSPRYCSTEGISVSTKMLELLNSTLLSHILYSIVKKQLDIL